jgi:hypothetical protein
MWREAIWLSIDRPGWKFSKIRFWEISFQGPSPSGRAFPISGRPILQAEKNFLDPAAKRSLYKPKVLNIARTKLATSLVISEELQLIPGSGCGSPYPSRCLEI